MGAFEDFLRAESMADRRAALAQMGRGKRVSGWMPWWHVLALIPDAQERAHLVSSLPLSLIPNPSWKLLRGLIVDPEPDVSGAAINALASFQIKSLGHDLKKAIQLHASSQRVLYCSMRYSELSHDDLILTEVYKQVSAQHSDAFLARCFWTALAQLKIDKTLLNVAMAIVEEAQASLNLERKSIVAVVSYLFFAGTGEMVEELSHVASNCLNSETRWLVSQCRKDWERLSRLGVEDKAQALVSSFQGHKTPCLGLGTWSEEMTQGVVQCVLDRLTSSPPENALAMGSTQAIVHLGTQGQKCQLAGDPQLGFRSSLPIADLIWQQWCQVGTPSDPVFVEGLVSSHRGQKWFIENPHKSLASVIRCHEELLGKFENREDLYPQGKAQIDSFVQLGLALRGRASFPPPYSIPQVYGPELTQNLSLFDWGPPHWMVDSPSLDQCLLALAQSFSQGLTSGSLGPEAFIYRCVGSLTLMLAQGFAHKCLVSRPVLLSLKSAVEQITHALATIGHDFKDNVSSIFSSAPDSDEEEGHVEPLSLPPQNPIQLVYTLIWVLLSQEPVPFEMEKLLQSSLRWAHHVEKRWVVRALCKIDTEDSIKSVLYFALYHVDNLFVLFTVKELLNSTQSQAHQALIRLVGKKNVSDDIKFLILEEVPLSHPEAILASLKSLHRNQLSEQLQDALKDTIGRVMGLVENTSLGDPKGTGALDTSLDTDSRLRIYLKKYDSLSIEVKSALRTSEMIFVQSQSWIKEAVDLSPIVNMQFKAVELVMRESFEPYTDALLRKGVLSKKLDGLGYGRPIPEKMQHFEDHLGDLPIIQTIPYFSKFKLRKMLRAICTYRPGKRFTLDGPKAFALFFLVVSRHQCPYGLAQMLPLNFDSDKSFFEYVKLVHALQDSRNRAVHEGLTWEAQEKISDLRMSSFHVIEESLEIGRFLAKNQNA